jgi:hypothetical protein
MSICSKNTNPYPILTAANNKNPNSPERLVYLTFS